MLTFCQCLKGRQCQRRGISGQKKPKTCIRSLWMPLCGTTTIAMQDLPLRKEEFLSKIITFNLCFERESRQIATCHVMSTMLTNLHSIVNCLLLHVTMGWNYFWNSILFMLFMFMHLKFSWNTKVVAVWRASSKQHHRFRKELPYWDNALFATRMSNSFNFTCKTFMPR